MNNNNLVSEEYKELAKETITILDALFQQGNDIHKINDFILTYERVTVMLEDKFDRLVREEESKNVLLKQS